MSVYRLPDGKLVVPMRAEAEGGIIGDAMVPIGPDHPDHAKWVAWLKRSGQKAIPVKSWPPPKAGKE